MLLALPLLLGCSSSQRQVLDVFRGTPVERQARAVLAEQLGPHVGQIVQARARFEDIEPLVRALERLVVAIWGEGEREVPSQRRYVKYGNDYEARVIVDFEQGRLRVETVAEDAPLDKLHTAVVMALLTPRDLTLGDIFSDREPRYDGEPFLYRQVLDQDDEPIRYRWRAERYASWLIDNALERNHYQGRERYAVATDLVDNHLHLRQLQFADTVTAAARRYGVAAERIYAVIEVESAFNPYAVSPANAYGLMQVVPATAGRDVYERIRRQSGEPSREELFESEFNIDIGTAYLHLLERQYLAGIRDPESRGHAQIAAYNGGPGSVLRTFGDSSASAIRRINALSPTGVYQQLISQHPFAETRQYLVRVRTAERRYQP